MQKPIIAIGLDAAEPKILEKWMFQGHLPNLNNIRQQGTYGRLDNYVEYAGSLTETSSTERLWVMSLTGCLPHKTGYWGPVRLESGTYNVTHDTVNGAYDYQEYPQFYALGKERKVCIFDVPVSALSEQVNGLQTLGWGGHAPHTPSHSQPPELLPEIVAKYGENPVLHKDYGYWWDPKYFQRIRQALKTSTQNRAAIAQDLLKREDWDLFLTVFGDTHSSGHDFWHLSQPDHPLYPYLQQEGAEDPMLTAFKDVDRAVGEIFTAAPEDAYKVLFAVHGMGSNVTDVFSMVMLGEFLYRFSFPGKSLLKIGKPGTVPGTPITEPRKPTWTGEMWQYFADPNPIKWFLRRWAPDRLHNKLDQIFHFPKLNGVSQPGRFGTLHWQPALWYQPYWSKMKAFALPAFAVGHVRVNLQGREPGGIVAVSEYEAVCDELTAKLYRLTDARTGEPLVREVVRTRKDPLDSNPKLPDPDLVVLWAETPTDTVDSPDYGRIGPVTYYRSGGHRPQGFLMAQGEGITPGSSFSGGHAVDIGPTILQLMGLPTPEYSDGQAMFKMANLVK